jgi:hypothetical protein
MITKCNVCDKVFDSHDGGTIRDEITYCPECEKMPLVEVIRFVQERCNQLRKQLQEMKDEMFKDHKDHIV